MATTAEISNELLRLFGAYPAVKISNPESTIREFISQLEEFELDVLRRAIDEHMRKCKWFPTISELRELCRKFDRMGSAVEVDWMAARLEMLWDAWFQNGVFEEGDWMQLIEWYEKSERTCKAEQARRKMGHIKIMAFEAVEWLTT